MGMDVDYIVAKRRLDELEDLVSDLDYESPEKEELVDEIEKFVEKMKNKYSEFIEE